jgi:DNA polymerase I-like protein with 3'-5' exonuclease and polymerase domains
VFGRRAKFELYEPKWGQAKNGKALPYTQAVEAYGSNVVRAYTHKALNALLQGSAADLMKTAMRDRARSGVDKVIGVPLLTCHDELGDSVGYTKVQREAANEVKHIMENCMKLRVPVVADQSFGINWGQAK